MTTSLAPGALRYTRASVERALDLHQREHRIKDWHRDPDGGAGHVITTSLGDALATHSLRETMLVVQGLGSAGQSAAIPGRAGSPAMRVVSAIETGQNEYIAIVVSPGTGNLAVTRAYQAADGTWQATGSQYDFLHRDEAQRVMAERAGIPVATRRLRRQRAAAVLASQPYGKNPDQAENLLTRAETGLRDGRHRTWMYAGRAAVIAYRDGEDVRFDIRDRDPDQVPGDHARA